MAWADVWKRGCFAWEYKGKHKNLKAALKQLQLYQDALENPPLLVVSDIEPFEIHPPGLTLYSRDPRFHLDDLLDAVAERCGRTRFHRPDRSVEAGSQAR